MSEQPRAQATADEANRLLDAISSTWSELDVLELLGDCHSALGGASGESARALNVRAFRPRLPSNYQALFEREPGPYRGDVVRFARDRLDASIVVNGNVSVFSQATRQAADNLFRAIANLLLSANGRASLRLDGRLARAGVEGVEILSMHELPAEVAAPAAELLRRTGALHGRRRLGGRAELPPVVLANRVRAAKQTALAAEASAAAAAAAAAPCLVSATDGCDDGETCNKTPSSSSTLSTSARAASLANCFRRSRPRRLSASPPGRRRVHCRDDDDTLFASAGSLSSQYSSSSPSSASSSPPACLRDLQHSPPQTAARGTLSSRQARAPRPREPLPQQVAADSNCAAADSNCAADNATPPTSASAGGSPGASPATGTPSPAAPPASPAHVFTVCPRAVALADHSYAVFEELLIRELLRHEVDGWTRFRELRSALSPLLTASEVRRRRGTSVAVGLARAAARAVGDGSAPERDASSMWHSALHIFGGINCFAGVEGSGRSDLQMDVFAWAAREVIACETAADSGARRPATAKAALRLFEALSCLAEYCHGFADDAAVRRLDPNLAVNKDLVSLLSDTDRAYAVCLRLASRPSDARAIAVVQSRIRCVLVDVAGGDLDVATFVALQRSFALRLLAHRCASGEECAGCRGGGLCLVSTAVESLTDGCRAQAATAARAVLGGPTGARALSRLERHIDDTLRSDLADADLSDAECDGGEAAPSSLSTGVPRELGGLWRDVCGVADCLRGGDWSALQQALMEGVMP